MKRLLLLATMMAIAVGCDRRSTTGGTAKDAGTGIAARTTTGANVQPTPSANTVPSGKGTGASKSVHTTPPAKPVSQETAIGAFLEKYLGTLYAERGKYVTDPDEYNAGYEALYRDRDQPVDPKVKIVSVKAGSKPDYLRVRSQILPDPQLFDLYVVKVGKEYKLDWGATVGFSPVGYKAFAAGSDDTATFRVVAELSDYFNYHYTNAKPTHHSVSLVEQFGERFGSFNGYARKDSEAGRKLYALVKDGQKHQIIVTVRKSGRETSVVEITDFVSATWVK
jgi:hypothetical protein